LIGLGKLPRPWRRFGSEDAWHQQRALSGRAYARAAVSVLSRISPSASQVKHPLTQVRPIEKALLIVITSDKGLAGSLNAAVLKEAEKVIAAFRFQKTGFQSLRSAERQKNIFARADMTFTPRTRT